MTLPRRRRGCGTSVSGVAVAPTAVSEKERRTEVESGVHYLGFDGCLLTPLGENLTHLEIAVHIILYVTKNVPTAVLDVDNGTSTTIGFFGLTFAFSFCFIFFSCGCSNATSGCTTGGSGS
jgi:hypothetical protein